VEDAGQTLYAPAIMDFDGQVDRSFLPAMLQLAKENDLTLVFVRTKTLMFPEYTSEPFALRSYIQSLNSYMRQRGAYFFDFAYDARIKSAYFSDNLHFNAEGREVFTQLLSNELKPLLK
jgi:lysophospholipase L1-like esterase